jgi:hypothetical protein
MTPTATGALGADWEGAGCAGAHATNNARRPKLAVRERMELYMLSPHRELGRFIAISRQFESGCPRCHSPRACNTRRPLHFLKGAILDLSDPLARDTKLGREFIEREQRVDEPAPFEDLTFAVVKDHQRLAQRGDCVHSCGPHFDFARDGAVLRSSLSVHIRTFVSGTRPFADVFDLMKSGKHFFKKAARSSFRLQSELARVSLAALLSRAW